MPKPKELDDFNYLIKKYPKIAFNVRSPKGIPNDREHGKEYLLPTEGYIMIPDNYNLEFIKEYRGFITYNSKFYEKYKNEINIILINGYPDWNNYYKLEDGEFASYDEKIKGICILNRIYKTGEEGEILYLRKQIFNNIKGIIKHSYGGVPFGGKHYQKITSSPSNKKSLQIINKYLFCLTLESGYHEMWSWDRVTERLWNCFRAKTMSIYFGCYNVEKLIPKEFYIDLRDYMIQEKPIIKFDYKRLVNDLNSFPKEKYLETVENAYEWQKNNKIGSISELEKVLGRLK